jgi:hypothetical protein
MLKISVTPINRPATAVIILPISILLLMFGCNKTPSPVPAASHLPDAEVHRADFVLCIDDSRSIGLSEQRLVREVAMLLADLADVDDQISLITFGRDAHLVDSVLIHNDADRIAFKESVLKKIDFIDNYSDIRAGLRVMKESQSKIFRSSGTVRVPILLSDGKLEPADRKTATAFSEMEDCVRGLKNIGIYAVVLGDTTSRDTILPGIDGLTLMRQHIAGGPDYFYHAHTLDQLLDVAVSILSKVKGISSLGEKAKTQFKIDRTVESMTLIVRKKSSGGEEYCSSSDIRLKRVQPSPEIALEKGDQVGQGAPLESLYWASDYEYFDLIVAKKPQPGIWEASLANGKKVDVLSKIVTNVDLKYLVRNRYYHNERAAISAWLFDSRSKSVSRGPYRIQAHLSAGDALEGSPVFTTLHPDEKTGNYLLAVPDELEKSLGNQNKPGPISLELIADQPSNGDPWFVRRSQLVSIDIAPPFIDWIETSPKHLRIPFWGRTLNFGALLHDSKNRKGDDPDFESPPLVTFILERLHGDDGSYEKIEEKSLEAAPYNGNIRYLWNCALPAGGAYRYSYQLTGTTRSLGPFAVQSPWYEMKVRTPWGESAGLLFLILIIFSSMRVQLKGRLVITFPNGVEETVRVSPAKSYESSKIPNLPGEIPKFRLEAKRLFLKSWIRLRLLRGTATVNKSRISEGQEISLRPGGSHVLTSQLDTGEVSVRIHLTT